MQYAEFFSVDWHGTEDDTAYSENGSYSRAHEHLPDDHNAEKECSTKALEPDTASRGDKLAAKLFEVADDSCTSFFDPLTRMRMRKQPTMESR